MDIDYLLLLQNFREDVLHGTLNNFFVGFSDFVISPYPFLFFAIVYWLINKKDGMFFFMNLCIAKLVNEIIKLIACVYRPWILDSRIVPAGNTETLATGYSFPSGHTSMAVSIFSSLGRMLVKLGKIFVFLCCLFVLMIGFSRNILGVHTPQDVLVAIVCSSIVFLFSCKIYDKVYECSKKYDWIILICCLGLGLAAFLFYTFKPYRMDYVDGNLLVNPCKMIADANEANAMFCSFWIGWFIERRFIKFRTFRNKKIGILISIICFIPLALMQYFLLPLLIQCFGNSAAYAMYRFFQFMYVLDLVPILINYVNSKYTSCNTNTKK